MPPSIKHWSEGPQGDWQGKDDTGRVRCSIDKFGNLTLIDDTGRVRVEVTPNALADERPLINLQDPEGARVFAVFSTGVVTIGRVDRPIMHIDADGTIHVKPGAIVEDLT